MPDQRQPIFQVDAFTAEPFRGNPAAVCPLVEAADDDWMQAVAREMNLSETAFVWPEGHIMRLRWFTPAVEVDLCGHATLATAHLLWEERLLEPSRPARFLTRSGELTAELRDGWITMDFPAQPPHAAPTPAGLTEALGAEPRWVGRGPFDVFVELDSESAVRELQPDMARLRAIETRGVIVTAPADSARYDVVSRFFAPRAGVDEDPVTGSAHCCLGPFWAERLGRTEITAYQASPRGGIVRVRVSDGRALLTGQAVTVLRGTLLV